MPRRMAITIAGAVSLGSYEAGVLYELLEALRRHNAAAKSEDEKIYVDVITGASAGGMTAAMAAQRLLYDAANLSDPREQCFLSGLGGAYQFVVAGENEMEGGYLALASFLRSD